MNIDYQQIGQDLQNAWLRKDLDVLASLLSTKNLEWYEGSFDDALTSSEAVLEEWRAALHDQNNLQVTVILLDAVDNRAYYACRASWTFPNGDVREIDGIFVVRLDGEGKIAYFNQWWTAKAPA